MLSFLAGNIFNVTKWAVACNLTFNIRTFEGSFGRLDFQYSDVLGKFVTPDPGFFRTARVCGPQY